KVTIKGRLVDLLGVSDSAEDDLDFFTSRTMQGSCQWLLYHQSFQEWVAESPEASSFLWLPGNPGSGKATLASFAVALLKSRSFSWSCRYYFFVAGHLA